MPQSLFRITATAMILVIKMASPEGHSLNLGITKLTIPSTRVAGYLAQGTQAASAIADYYEKQVAENGLKFAFENAEKVIYQTPSCTVTTRNPLNLLAEGLRDANYAQEELTQSVAQGVGFNPIAAAATTANTYFCKALRSLQKPVKEFVGALKAAWPGSPRQKQLSSLVTACKESWTYIIKAASTAKTCIKNEADALTAFFNTNPKLFQPTVIAATFTALAAIALYEHHLITQKAEKEKRAANSIYA